MKEGHRETGGTSLGAGGPRPRRATIMGCVLRSDASWGLGGRRGEAWGGTHLARGVARAWPGAGPVWTQASTLGSCCFLPVGGMELKDPPALAGGSSKKPWDAENVISPLGMPPVKQEAQRRSNNRHDGIMSLSQLATRSSVRSPCGPLFGHLCKEAAHCFRASQVALRLRIRLPIQETWVPSPGPKIPWSRKQQPTPVFLPGKVHGQRSLVGYGPRGHRFGHD